MFRDWGAIIGTVGSIFGYAPPSCCYCDHVSPQKDTINQSEDNANCLGISPRKVICSGLGVLLSAPSA